MLPPGEILLTAKSGSGGPPRSSFPGRTRMDLARLDLGRQFVARFAGRGFQLDGCLGRLVSLALQPGESRALVRLPSGEAVLAEPDNHAAHMMIEELVSF